MVRVFLIKVRKILSIYFQSSDLSWIFDRKNDERFNKIQIKDLCLVENLYALIFDFYEIISVHF